MIYLLQMIRWLLISLTISLSQFEVAPLIEFFMSLIGIFIIAERLKIATEDLCEHLGQHVGGMLLGFMGNLPEIIVSMLALSKGMVNVVKASLSGSMIGNLLCGLGAAMLAGGLQAGGLKYKSITFNRRMARIHSSLVVLAACGMLIPAIFHITSQNVVESISVEISIILIFIYVMSLIFTYYCSQNQLELPQPGMATGTIPMDLYDADDDDEVDTVAPRTMTVIQHIPASAQHEHRPKASIRSALGRLFIYAIMIAFVSEVLTDALIPVSAQFGFSDVFTGVILLSLGGNIGEYLNAISFARAGKMDLAVQATLGSATQVALLVSPVLVLFSILIGDKMDLNFTSYEVASVLMAVMVTRSFTYDGETNWFEGAMMLSVYLILGLGFYHLTV